MAAVKPRELHTLIGEHITTWALVESALFDICHDILKSDKKLTAIVFYRTPTLSSRLSLTDDLVKSLFPRKKSGEHSPPHLIEWVAIQRETDGLLPKRNALAHHPVQRSYKFIGSPNPEHRSVQGPFFEITPSANEQLRGGPIKPIHPSAIPDLTKQVGELHKKCRAFRKKLKVLLAESAPQSNSRVNS